MKSKLLTLCVCWIHMLENFLFLFLIVFSSSSTLAQGLDVLCVGPPLHFWFSLASIALSFLMKFLFKWCMFGNLRFCFKSNLGILNVFTHEFLIYIFYKHLVFLLLFTLRILFIILSQLTTPCPLAWPLPLLSLFIKILLLLFASGL